MHLLLQPTANSPKKLHGEKRRLHGSTRREQQANKDTAIYTRIPPFFLSPSSLLLRYLSRALLAVILYDLRMVSDTVT